MVTQLYSMFTVNINWSSDILCVPTHVHDAALYVQGNLTAKVYQMPKLCSIKLYVSDHGWQDVGGSGHNLFKVLTILTFQHE
jgi:hypothetical protein